MAHGQFIVTQVNPNDNMGGGGCVCDPRKQVDCKPPYVVCYANDMESHLSPHVVICEACLAMMNAAVGGEVYGGAAENTYFQGGNQVLLVNQRENPEVNDDELVAALKDTREDE